MICFIFFCLALTLKVHSHFVFRALSIRLSFRHSLNLKEFLKAISMLSYVRVYGQAWCLLLWYNIVILWGFLTTHTPNMYSGVQRGTLRLSSERCGCIWPAWVGSYWPFIIFYCRGGESHCERDHGSGPCLCFLLWCLNSTSDDRRAGAGNWWASVEMLRRMDDWATYPSRHRAAI